MRSAANNTTRPERWAAIICQIRQWVSEGSATRHEFSDVVREFCRRNEDDGVEALRLSR